MPIPPASRLSWVILTTGRREEQLADAIESVSRPSESVVVVSNGAGLLPAAEATGATVVVSPKNLGVPGGRDLGFANVEDHSHITGFLDDDAVAPPGTADRLIEEFATDERLGAVSLRLIDEHHQTARRHVPRPGGRGPERSGETALFLGGACAVRRKAYEDVGGYFTELFYGHEEVELCWRLVDHGWTIRYLANVEVFHPRTLIERHPNGWELTGRNRVWIARRSLPWPIALVHVTAWLMLGVWRAPNGESRRRYLSGWRAGWSADIDHRPIRWRTVWRLTWLGRPPIF